MNAAATTEATWVTNLVIGIPLLRKASSLLARRVFGALQHIVQLRIRRQALQETQ
jgi:hypothetical protein